MVPSITMFSVLALGSICSSIAVGQTQGPALFAGDRCVKVREGKAQEYRALRQNVSAKLAAVRGESGASSSYAIAQAVAPTGTPVRRDYHLVATCAGFPPDPAGAERMAADRKKAGRTMSRETVIAKRDELTDLAGIDVRRWRERMGQSAKDVVARTNYGKVHSGMTGAWRQTATLVIPGGEDLPSSAVAIDVLPNWATQGKGILLRAIWENVHPNIDLSAHLARLAAVRNQPRVDVVRLVEFIERQHRPVRSVAALRQEDQTATGDPERFNPKARQSRLTNPATLATSGVLVRDAITRRMLAQRLWM